LLKNRGTDLKHPFFLYLQAQLIYCFATKKYPSKHERNSNMPQCSVIINTAHRADYLDRCLLAMSRQTCLDIEVIIADDGSDEATLRVVAHHERVAPFPIFHIWHPPHGHSRAEILNKGIAACRTDYILTTDCDALAPATLIAMHLQRRRPGRMLVGGCVKLNKSDTLALTHDGIATGDFERLLLPKNRRALLWTHWKNIWNIWTRRPRRPHNLGLNMSLERSALEAINGYDNAFHGWGNADGDLRERLKMVDVWPLSVWAEAFVFHQWHPTLKRGEGNAARVRRPNIPSFAADGLVEAHQRYVTTDLAEYQAFRQRALGCYVSPHTIKSEVVCAL
jgi:glycosyltransferase involved in cell wall biosynthesis